LASTVNLAPYTSNALEVSNYNSLGLIDSDPTPLLRTVDVIAPGVNASQLYYITVNISHAWNSDLDIILIAPDGSQIELSTDNGGSGDGYYGCHFTNVPSHPNITTVPVGVITGNFAPEQPFTALTGPMTGTWTLAIVDDASGDYGNFENFTLGYPEANSIVSYSWSPTTGLSDATIANPVATITSTTTYTLTVEDATGSNNNR
jgi:subtilisin-like proprotein convertase family protein